MGIADIIFLVLLGLAFFKGYQNGLIVEFFSLVAFFVGLFVALQLTIPVTEYFFEGSSYRDFGAIFIFIALFILLSFLIKICAKMIKTVIDFTFLGMLDNILGAFAGALKSAFIISMIFWLLESVGIKIGILDDSFVFSYIYWIGPTFFEWAGKLLPFFNDLIDNLNHFGNSKTVISSIGYFYSITG